MSAISFTPKQLKTPDVGIWNPEGSTGMWYEPSESMTIWNFTFETEAARVMNELNRLDYGGDNPDVWDCEDRAYWGVSHIRCKFPGVPIGIAYGTMGNVFHAPIILWYKDHEKEDWHHIWCNPNNNVGISKLENFSPIIIIPCPIWKEGHSGIQKTLPPFFTEEKNLIRKGKFAFNTQYDVSRYDEIKSYLENFFKNQEICQSPPSNTVEGRRFKNLRYSEDRALYLFSHARRHFAHDGNGSQSCAIGVAIGKAKIGPKAGDNHAVVMVWDKKGDYHYFDMDWRDDNGTVTGKFVNDFDPRFILF